MHSMVEPDGQMPKLKILAAVAAAQVVPELMQLPADRVLAETE
jgi:hypothetical protein